VKPTLAITALGLVLGGCSRDADVQVRKQLAGTWVVTGKYRDGGSFTSTIRIRQDGDYACRIIWHSESGTDRSSDLQGFFQIRAGVLIDTTTNHSNTNAVLPMTSRAHIVRFDGREMVLEWEHNQEWEFFPTNELVFRKVAP
jgi:hypothetical protein